MMLNKAQGQNQAMIFCVQTQKKNKEKNQKKSRRTRKRTRKRKRKREKVKKRETTGWIVKGPSE